MGPSWRWIVDLPGRPTPILEWNGALYRTDREIRDRLKALYVERIEDIRANGLDPRVAALLQ